MPSARWSVTSFLIANCWEALVYFIDLYIAWSGHHYLVVFQYKDKNLLVIKPYLPISYFFWLASLLETQIAPLSSDTSSYSRFGIVHPRLGLAMGSQWVSDSCSAAAAVAAVTAVELQSCPKKKLWLALQNHVCACVLSFWLRPKTEKAFAV